MQRRRALQPSQLGKRRRRKRRNQLYLWVSGLAMLFLAIAFSTHLPQLSIKNIDISGTSVVPKDTLQSLSENDIKGNYGFLFSRRNFLLYPKGKIAEDIFNTYPQVENVSIKLGGVNKLLINISERKPVGLWCQGNGSIIADCYFLDKSGYIFDKAPVATDTPYFTYFGLIGADDPVGRNYLTATQFKDVNSLIANIKKLGISTNVMLAVDSSDFELNLIPSGKILFTTNQSVDTTFSNLETVLNKNNPDNTHIELNTIDYVDLRFGNKIFYKLKSSAGAATSTSL